MIMPFGQYEGYDIKDLPTNYLNWLIKNVDDREDKRYSIGQIKYYANKELQLRYATVNNIIPLIPFYQYLCSTLIINN